MTRCVAARKRVGCLRELEDERQAILKVISEQGELLVMTGWRHQRHVSKTGSKTSTCPISLNAAPRGQIAIEAGAEPLADLLWNTVPRS